RISGPLLDRIDIHIDVPAVRYRELAARQTAEPSAAIKARIEAARRCQRERLPDHPLFTNTRLTDPQLKAFCALDTESQRLLEMAVDRLGLSARAYTRILKVARTIADLESEADIRSPHVAEAIHYRTLDRALI
ncbi:MAG TPA: ATP-dependent protease, partial [Syntrophales bacterium]|nr:ATP-dependent protease [Syntrophales bacterium]